MAKDKTRIDGHSVKRGHNIAIGKGWRLVTPTGRAFKATLLSKARVSGEIVALFRVLPKPA
jgi:hypothetical protein